MYAFTWIPAGVTIRRPSGSGTWDQNGHPWIESLRERVTLKLPKQYGAPIQANLRCVLRAFSTKVELRYGRVRAHAIEADLCSWDWLSATTILGFFAFDFLCVYLI